MADKKGVSLSDVHDQIGKARRHDEPPEIITSLEDLPPEVVEQLPDHVREGLRDGTMRALHVTAEDSSPRDPMSDLLSKLRKVLLGADESKQFRPIAEELAEMPALTEFESSLMRGGHATEMYAQAVEDNIALRNLPPRQLSEARNQLMWCEESSFAIGKQIDKLKNQHVRGAVLELLEPEHDKKADRQKIADLDLPLALLREVSVLLRGYEHQHLEKAERDPVLRARHSEKALVNGNMAARIESTLEAIADVKPAPIKGGYAERSRRAAERRKK